MGPEEEVAVADDDVVAVEELVGVADVVGSWTSDELRYGHLASPFCSTHFQYLIVCDKSSEEMVPAISLEASTRL